MRLDAALACPDFVWRTTRTEKLAQLHAVAPVTPATDTPPASVSRRGDAFPGTFSIGLDAAGRVVLFYLATVSWTDDFRRFLIGHIALLAAVPTWTLRIVFPQPLQRPLLHTRRSSPRNCGRDSTSRRRSLSIAISCTGTSTISTGCPSHCAPPSVGTPGGSRDLGSPTSTSAGARNAAPRSSRSRRRSLRRSRRVGGPSNPSCSRTRTTISCRSCTLAARVIDEISRGREGGQNPRTPLTRSSTPLLNLAPMMVNALHARWRRRQVRGQVLRSQRVAPTRCLVRSAGGLCRPSFGGSCQRRYGTQDVNDPGSGPATRFRGRSRPEFRAEGCSALPMEPPRRGDGHLAGGRSDN